ncbi:hypothetical protein KAI92_05030 [Candidatus Parcubacteria bacterium]|nr:hypothetical protein [Candidatus Parcubacteria bacterium]
MQIGEKNREYKKKGKLHYNTKKYSNPFFQNKKKKRSSNTYNFPTKLRLLIILLFFLVLGISWFLLYSKYFKISEIEINGEGKIPATKVREIAENSINKNFFILYPKRNILIFKNKKLIETLKEKYSFDYLNINKKLPNKLIINYKEKEYVAIWQEFENLYFIDEEGYVVTKASTTDIKKQYPLLKNNTEFSIIDNKIGIKNDYLKATIKLSALISSYADELKIENYIIDPKEFNSIKIILREGPYLLFDITKNLEHQVDKLMIIKNEKIKDDFFKKEYIDLRTGDHVYFR